MPAYNTEDKILDILVKVDQIFGENSRDYEVIVVNDGSEDRTEQVVRSCVRLNPRVKLISYRKNVGKGYALRKGFAEASEDIVIFLDSDSDIDADQIKTHAKALEQYDMVIASKRHPYSEHRAPVMRKVLSASFNILVKILIGIRYSDTQAGLKAFRKKALEKIVKMGLVKRYSFDVELLALASLVKLRVLEAPVKVCQSAGFSLKSIMYMMIDLMGIFYRLRVIKWYQRNLNKKYVHYKPIIPT